MKVLTGIIVVVLVAESAGARLEIGTKIKKKSGAEPISPRIVNGSVASIETFPWMVLVETSFITKRHGCGGAILSPNHIITAAHCIEDLESYQEPTKITVGYGSSVRSRMQKANVRGYYKHERFVGVWNDIAMLLLDRPLMLTRNTKAITISEKTDLTGATVTVAGWGSPHENIHKGTEELMYTTKVVWSPEKCERLLPYFDQNVHVCAYADFSDSCKGDSGGPLMIQSGNTFKIVGLVTYGEGCNRPGLPTGYTKVSPYTSWIENARSNNNSYTLFQ